MAAGSHLVLRGVSSPQDTPFPLKIALVKLSSIDVCDCAGRSDSPAIRGSGDGAAPRREDNSLLDASMQQ